MATTNAKLALPDKSYQELMSSRSKTIDLLEQMTQQFSKRGPTLVDRIAAAELQHEIGEIRRRWTAEQLINTNGAK